MSVEPLKNIDKANESVIKTTKKGLLYYLCNVYIAVSLILTSITIGGMMQTSTKEPTKSVTAEFVQEHGISATLIAAFILFGCYFCGKYINQKDSEHRKDNIVKSVVDEEERRQVIKQKQHDALIQYRISITPKISNILKDLIINLGAAKVCVFEMHNGTNNVSGIPFLFADMLYEEAKDEKLYTMDEFKNLNLTRYSFIPRHLKEGSWCGTIESLTKEDPKLADKLKIINVEYAAMMLLEGVDRPIGFLQIYFDTPNHPANKEILSIANAAAQKITSLIDTTALTDILEQY